MRAWARSNNIHSTSNNINNINNTSNNINNINNINSTSNNSTKDNICARPRRLDISVRRLREEWHTSVDACFATSTRPTSFPGWPSADLRAGEPLRRRSGIHRQTQRWGAGTRGRIIHRVSESGRHSSLPTVRLAGPARSPPGIRARATALRRTHHEPPYAAGVQALSPQDRAPLWSPLQCDFSLLSLTQAV